MTTNLMQTIAGQRDSAVEFAARSGLRIGDNARVALTTGITIGTSAEESEGEVVFAHFCSSFGSWKVLKHYPSGNTLSPSPSSESVIRLIDLELPRTIPRFAFVGGTFVVNVHRNGLTLARVGPMLVAEIPKDILSDLPWARVWGPQLVADRMGYNDISAWLEREGAVVLN